MTRQEKRSKIKLQLQSYTKVRRECGHLAEQLTRIESAMLSPKIQALDGMPHGSGGGDPLADVVSAHLEVVEKYKQKLRELWQRMAAVEAIIEGLDDPTERTLARLRYIDGFTWEEICVKMTYSWPQVHRIHGRMLDKLVAQQSEEASAV